MCKLEKDIGLVKRNRIEIYSSVISYIKRTGLGSSSLSSAAMLILCVLCWIILALHKCDAKVLCFFLILLIFVGKILRFYVRNI
jgi:hypothetical protein